MFRIFLIPLLVVISVTLPGQDTLNITDGQGRRQGNWRKLDSAGNVIYTGHFKDGIPSGEFRYFYADGKLKTVSRVSDRGRRAVTTSYFRNGNKMAAGIYLNEKKDSTWLFFNEYNGTLVSEEQYKAGLRDGSSKVFYLEGGLSEVLHYKMGVRDGPWEQYFPNGKTMLRCAYKAGEKQGTVRTYFMTGKPMIEGQYVNGHPDGKWTYYDEKGVVTKKELFREGELIRTELPGKK